MALDQSARMLEHARARLAAYPDVRFVHALFQDWPGAEQPFDLAVAGLSWHWLLPGERDERVGAWLRPGGTLAVLVHWALAPWEEGQCVYAAHWPDHTPPERLTIEERIERVRRDFDAAGVLCMTDVGRWPWTARHDADGYVDLLNTFSDHVMLPAETRQRFLAAVRERIAELGGVVERQHESVAILARPVSRAAR